MPAINASRVIARSQLVEIGGGYGRQAAVSGGRPPTDYTARITSHYDGVAAPLELGQD